MSKQQPKHTLIVAGGGTGGHVLAGIAIADTWRARFGEQASILFVGACGGIEEKLVPRAGYPLRLLRLGSLKGQGLFQSLKTLALIPWAFLRSLFVLIQTRPSAVVGVGGYASGPLVLTARFTRGFLKCRVAILEQNAVPGLTNRILGQFADIVFTAFPGVDRQFKHAQCLVTGNPVRKSMVRMPPATHHPFTVFVFGGSQGAVGINSLVIGALPLLADIQSSLRWIHQTGAKDFERVRLAYEQTHVSARVEPFIYDMPECYLQSSLVVCRAGSSTLSELAAVGRAAVLIPFPYASDNHQEKNARIFENSGAAQILLQTKAQAPDLAQLIRQHFMSLSSVDQMAAKMSAFHREDAAGIIVKTLAQG